MVPPATIDARARDVFLEVVELDVEERDLALDSACDGDDSLRALVDELLRMDAASESFLEQPIIGIDWERLDRDDEVQGLVGSAVGSFEIESVIEQGGMGVVYKAQQRSPDRPVAVKVMRGWLRGEAPRRRFAQEVQILGRLRHPVIATIYEAGVLERDGARRPFFAMEYVPGARSITRFADEQRLGLRKRIELFVRVCEGVQHGHQQGVIHRDLKPDNILVDQDGNPKIIDFGVARATDVDVATTTMHTQAGEIVGTVQYMSPEQCEGTPSEIDTRSDVYSLGAVLYELLCGAPTHDLRGLSPISAMARLRECEITRPRRFRRGIRPDLERVMLKALARARPERYQSVDRLAEDLRCFLRGDPVSATAPGPLRRLMQMLRRHPIVTTAAICVLIVALTLGATSASVWWLGMQPNDLRISDDFSEATIVARNGTVLHSFETGQEYGIRSAEKFDPGGRYGDRWLATICFSARAESPHAGRLIVVDPVRPATPLWRTESASAAFDPPLAELREDNDSYAADFTMSGNILAESEGNELAVCFNHVNYSPTLLRIYSAEGEVLYEVWHDGAISDLYWMEEPRLMIGVGVCNRVRGSDLGEDDLFERQEDLYPPVVFALHPEIGVRHNTWLAGPDANVESRAVWYKAMAPTNNWGVIGFKRIEVPVALDRRKHCSLQANFAGPGNAPGSLLLVIDSDARIRHRTASDEYLDSGGPAAETVRLADLRDFDPNTRSRTY